MTVGRQPHWTEKSTDDFLYRIAADFVRQVESAMENAGVNQAGLAKRLKVSEGRVSQVLNNPGNLRLERSSSMCGLWDVRSRLLNTTIAIPKTLEDL